MKLQIIKADGAIAVDGVWKNGFNIPRFPGHALQWEDSHGVLECSQRLPGEQKGRHEELTSLAGFEKYIALWNTVQAQAPAPEVPDIPIEQRIEDEYENFHIARALINRQAQKEGITPRQLLNELIAQA